MGMPGHVRSRYTKCWSKGATRDMRSFATITVATYYCASIGYDDAVAKTMQGRKLRPSLVTSNLLGLL